MEEVIVIGKNYATALGVVRSLGEAGYRVKLLGINRGTILIASKSKYVTQYATAAPDFESMLSRLETLRGNADRILVIPTNDGICKTLDEHLAQLKQHYILPTAGDGAGPISGFMDKMVQKNLASKCGMKVAAGRCFETGEPVTDAAVADIPFPCFVKPDASADVKGCKTLFAVCKNTDELRRAIAYAASRDCARVLVERYLSIDEELCVYGVAGGGRVYAPACVVTFRGGFAEHKGVTAEGKVIPASDLGAMAGQIEEFVRTVGLTGLFCVDILRCGEDLYFSEMNLRFGGSGYAVTLAGANLPAALADIAYGRSVERPMSVSEQIVFLNERIELDAYVGGHITREEYRAHLSGGQKGFIRSEEDRKPWKVFRIIAPLKILKRRALAMLGK